MLSVVTITFNNYAELKATLESLRQVSYPLELIVINGGTCELSQSYLRHYAQENFKIKMVQEKDQGIADAFNKGVRLAEGSAITFLNSGDVLLDSQYYFKAEEFLQQHPQYSFIHSNILYRDPLLGDIFKCPALCAHGRGMPYHHQTMIVKREVFQQIGAFDLSFRIAMDYHFVIRMERAGFLGYYFNQSLPVVLMDGSGVSATQEEKSLQESWRALQETASLNTKNITSFAKRWTFFKIRQGLQRAGLHLLLRRSKQLKNYLLNQRK